MYFLRAHYNSTHFPPGRLIYYLTNRYGHEKQAGMTYNLEFFLTAATLVSGITLILSCWLKRKKYTQNRFFSITETIGSFFIVLLIVLVIRSFIIEPFRIPSGSMLPTLEVGDFILVNKFSYGLRLPIIRSKFFDIDSPKRGDVVVFKYPQNPRQDFIKRVIGLPGDTVQYRDKIVYVNQIKTAYKVIDDQDDGVRRRQVTEEQLFGRKHRLLIYREAYANDGMWVVPEGHYFVMGDNRDNSNDSRRWGFVPETNLLGRAFFIWFHWNWGNGVINTERIGNYIE